VEQLDREKGATVTDKAVFDKLSRKFEKHYMEDMAALGIKEPDVLTRVTE
jgi:cysteinyl-tRNA synthetase